MKPRFFSIIFVMYASSAFASPDGEWRCKANGDIPTGVLTIAGSSYEFVVVKDTAWTPKTGDPGNGSGSLRIDGPHMTPNDGPLLSVYESTLAYCGAEEGCGGNEIVDVNNAAGALMRCWRP